MEDLRAQFHRSLDEHGIDSPDSSGVGDESGQTTVDFTNQRRRSQSQLGFVVNGPFWCYAGDERIAFVNPDNTLLVVIAERSVPLAVVKEELSDCFYRKAVAQLMGLFPCKTVVRILDEAVEIRSGTNETEVVIETEFCVDQSCLQRSQIFVFEIDIA